MIDPDNSGSSGNIGSQNKRGYHIGDNFTACDQQSQQSYQQLSSKGKGKADGQECNSEGLTEDTIDSDDDDIDNTVELLTRCDLPVADVPKSTEEASTFVMPAKWTFHYFITNGRTDNIDIDAIDGPYASEAGGLMTGKRLAKTNEQRYNQVFRSLFYFALRPHTLVHAQVYNDPKVKTLGSRSQSVPALTQQLQEQLHILFDQYLFPHIALTTLFPQTTGEILQQTKQQYAQAYQVCQQYFSAFVASDAFSSGKYSFEYLSIPEKDENCQLPIVLRQQLSSSQRIAYNCQVNKIVGLANLRQQQQQQRDADYTRLLDEVEKKGKLSVMPEFISHHNLIKKLNNPPSNFDNCILVACRQIYQQFYLQGYSPDQSREDGRGSVMAICAQMTNDELNSLGKIYIHKRHKETVIGLLNEVLELHKKSNEKRINKKELHKNLTKAIYLKLTDYATSTKQKANKMVVAENNSSKQQKSGTPKFFNSHEETSVTNSNNTLFAKSEKLPSRIKQYGRNLSSANMMTILGSEGPENQANQVKTKFKPSKQRSNTPGPCRREETGCSSDSSMIFHKKVRRWPSFYAGDEASITRTGSTSPRTGKNSLLTVERKGSHFASTSTLLGFSSVGLHDSSDNGSSTSKILTPEWQHGEEPKSVIFSPRNS